MKKNKCNHTELIKITHWWFNFKCKSCGKRFRNPPSDDYFYWELE